MGGKCGSKVPGSVHNIGEILHKLDKKRVVENMSVRKGKVSDKNVDGVEAHGSRSVVGMGKKMVVRRGYRPERVL